MGFTAMVSSGDIESGDADSYEETITGHKTLDMHAMKYACNEI